MNTTNIALFRNRADAETLQQRLAQNGVAATVNDCRQINAAKIEAPTDQFERAYNLLVQWDQAEGVLRSAIRCPECRSLRVDYPQYSHKSILPNFLVGFLTLIHAAEKEFYCHDCHFTWPKEGIRPSRVRPHSAPYYFIDGIEQSSLPDRSHAA